jgi:hypothetical protein
MNRYKALKEKHQQEVNTFPMRFAFSDKQFEEGMRELGLSPEDTDKIYALPGTGGFYKRTDAPTLHEMFDRHEKERQEAIAGDQTGDGYIFDMFYYELGNHEYCYTGSTEQTLDYLDFTMDEINKDKRLKHGLEKAKKAQWEADRKRG